MRVALRLLRCCCVAAAVYSGLLYFGEHDQFVRVKTRHSKLLVINKLDANQHAVLDPEGSCNEGTVRQEKATQKKKKKKKKKKKAKREAKQEREQPRSKTKQSKAQQQ